MLTFKQHLTEAREISQLTTAEIIHLFSTEFSDSVKHITATNGSNYSVNGKLLFRGMTKVTSGDSVAAKVHTPNTDRKPLAGGEYYTALFNSNPANDEWPNRLRSAICTTEHAVASSWSAKREGLSGRVHVCFPKNGTVVAMSEVSDIWQLKLPLLTEKQGTFIPLSRLDMAFAHLVDLCQIHEFAADVLDCTKVSEIFENVYKDFDDRISTGGAASYFSKWYDAFDRDNFVKNCTYQSGGCQLTNNFAESTMSGECWFEGEYIAVPLQIFPDFVEVLVEAGVINES
jgi:hypothetical protein